MIAQPERLAQVFTELCEISSPSKQEAAVATYIKRIFTALGADKVYEDDSAAATGSDSGNIIVTFNGDKPEQEPVVFACHMDTVIPANNVQVVRNGDMFTSAGDTILGGDDKSGIAALIELFTLIQEQKLSHGKIELLFTTCEEIGLLGAKNLEKTAITARHGIALDASTVNTLITKAPSANEITITLHGLAAHAGLAPEQGINTLSIAAEAIGNVQIGRHDEETTSNIGLIQGGKATNIVPDKLLLVGEVRSHNKESLKTHTDNICNAFENAVAAYHNPHHNKRPTVDIKVVCEYDSIDISPSSTFIQSIQNAGKTVGQDILIAATGGGSDANVLNGYGIEMAILGTGMEKVHTIEEQIRLSDMLELTKTLYAIVAN